MSKLNFVLLILTLTFIQLIIWYYFKSCKQLYTIKICNMKGLHNMTDSKHFVFDFQPATIILIKYFQLYIMQCKVDHKKESIEISTY